MLQKVDNQPNCKQGEADEATEECGRAVNKSRSICVRLKIKNKKFLKP